MWLLLIILAVPLIEIGLFVQIGGMIGMWATIAWVIVSAGLGIVVLKGWRPWARSRSAATCTS